MDGGDSRLQRVARRAGRERMAVERERARVGANAARQNIGQGGLARAVFTQQDVNLADAGLKVDLVERDRAPEAFGYWRQSANAVSNQALPDDCSGGT